MSKAIYLAGKIAKNDWRHHLVPALAQRSLADAQSGDEPKWSILPRAIWGRFDYAGPFFMACDHGCYHGEPSAIEAFHEDGDAITSNGREGQHGYGLQNTCDSCTPRWFDKPHNWPGGTDLIVSENCLAAITRADVFFIWLTTNNCYGTLVEAGYAKAFQKHIICGIPESQQRNYQLHRELWFLTSISYPVVYAATAEAALREGLLQTGDFFDSPLEVNFWQRWRWNEAVRTHRIHLTPQLVVLGGRYRLDFAHVPTKVAIELDGFTYHNQPDAFQRDRQRDRELTTAGWRIVRFASQELRDNLDRCVDQAVRVIQSVQG